MKKILAMAMAVCVGFIGAGDLVAKDSAPIQFSTLNGFNAPDKGDVGGARFSLLHGKNRSVTGVDFPLIISMSETDTLVGVNFPLGFGASKINKEMTGLALGVFNWHLGMDTGINSSVVNVTNDVKGLNLGAINYATGRTIVDLGTVNISKGTYVQVGLFNKTKELKGVQIGLLNFADDGFLPFFPFILF